MKDDWPYYALALFGVVSGQIGRLGRSLEKGEPLTLRKVFVELSMLPAFGGLGGAIAVEWAMPIWMVLVLSITAGWMGFATFRAVASAARQIVLKLAEPPKDE